MKKKILLFLLLFSFVCFSQEKGTNDISISIGAITSNNISHFLENELLSGAFGTVSYEDDNSGVSLNLAYKRAIEDHLFLYGEFSFQNTKQELTLRKINIGNANLKYSTIAVGINYRYINTEWFKMYSGVALGFTHKSVNYSLEQNRYDELKNSEESSGTLNLFSNSIEQEYDQLKNSTENYFNFQLNGLGLRVGKSLAGTIEIGYGYKGVVSFGLSYQF